MKRLAIALVIAFLLILTAGLYLFFQNNRNAKELVLYGNVDVRQVDIGFRVPGKVIAMPYQEGDYIEPGTLIAMLDKEPYEDEVRKARATIKAKEAALKNAEYLVERRSILVGEGAVAKEDYETAVSDRDVIQAELNEAKAALGVFLTRLGDTCAFAPNEGVILTRIREPGSVVREADPVYTLSLTSPVWIRAYVSEPELGRIYPGMHAEIYTDTKGAPVYTGHIGFISPVAEFTPKSVETTQLRTELVYRLRIIADNPDKGLRQGMPVTVKLISEKKSD